MLGVKKAQSESKERTFESALARLEEIVARLESSEVSLEEAIGLVQEGDELSRFCEQQLRAAEGKILQLVERLGEVELAPVERAEEEDAQEG
jgi:exodeoxyribonuclease VII small subunit